MISPLVNTLTNAEQRDHVAIDDRFEGGQNGMISWRSHSNTALWGRQLILRTAVRSPFHKLEHWSMKEAFKQDKAARRKREYSLK